MIALVDCNNFYASCEEVFHPKLRNKPLIILSNNDGCVIARSKKAKDIGIQMGEPAYLFKDKIAAGAIQALSSNFALYDDMSRRVMETLESLSPDMEVYSIDEAFFHLLEEPREVLLCRAVAAQEKVKQWTGIPISIGMARTKTLAKVANKIAKKNGFPCLLAEENEIQARLEQTALEDIWGIGSQLAQRLKAKGIYTAAQFKDQSDDWLRTVVGVGGLRTAFELRGVPCFGLEEGEEKKQSITCSRSFGRAVGELPVLEEAISAFTVRAAQKLRAQGSKVCFLSIFLQAGFPRQSYSCFYSLPTPSSYTPELITLAKQGVASLFRPGVEYKKGGVVFSDLVDEGTCQFDFLAARPVCAQKETVMRLVDQINAAFGKHSIRFLAEGVERKYRAIQQRRTPRFTTSWDELLTIE